MVRVSEQCLGSADQPDARANVGARLARRNGAGVWWQRLSLPAEGGNWSGAATPVLSTPNGLNPPGPILGGIATSAAPGPAPRAARSLGCRGAVGHWD